MTCAAPPPVFRLLDAYVGWDPLADWAVENIGGLDDPDGIRLTGTSSSAVDIGSVSPWLLPPRLARGADCCTFYLAGVSGSSAPLLRLSPCDDCFQRYPLETAELVAIASGHGRLAAIEAGGLTRLIDERSGRVIAELALPGARLAAFTPDGDLVVVHDDDRLTRYGIDGGVRDSVYRPPPGAKIVRLAIASDRSVWVVVERAETEVMVSRAPNEPFAPSTLDALGRAFPTSGIAISAESGFCFDADHTPRERARCFRWDGCPGTGVHPPSGQSRPLRRGQLLTTHIDSGIRRCEWHRVRADAIVPPGTTLEIAVAVAEQVPPPPTSKTALTDEWQPFAAGVPHPLDWQAVSATAEGSLDFLIDQPRGRYLFVRIRMTSETAQTPLLRRVRIDLPRSTSLMHLPAVYAENPEARAFTAQFLSLFDATVETFDEAIERFPQLLDIDYAPVTALPFIGRMLAVELDDTWPVDQRRKVLREAMQLYRRRGTRLGLAHAVRLTFPHTDSEATQPVIRELALERPWGSLGKSELGSVRLFGRSRARLRLGTSTLGSTPIRSFGDPARDPIDALASRIEVLIPPQFDRSREALLEQLRELVDAQKPAHTIASVRVGGGGFALGMSAMVGIDTVATSPPPAVVGGADAGGTIRLGRNGVLSRGKRGAGMQLGITTSVGIDTALR